MVLRKAGVSRCLSWFPPSDLRMAKEVQTIEVYKHEVRACPPPHTPCSPFSLGISRVLTSSSLPPSLPGVLQAPQWALDRMFGN